MYKNARLSISALVCVLFFHTSIYAIPVDSDSDGIADTVEGDSDPDGDGIPNFLDRDSDGDRVPDTLERGDTDGDGVPNYLDTDSDKDGIDDSIEARVSGLDTDNDGIDDLFDPDHAAVQWEVKVRFGIFRGAGDFNGDGVEDWYGQQDPVDSDRDGISDMRDSDSDGDRLPDTIEGAGDWDKDGLPNYRDHDSDNDGIGDRTEAMVTGGDPDNDGIDNTFDVDWVGENGGSGIDNDKDGVDDALEVLGTLDLDSDNDGIADWFEPGDFDLDGIPDFIDLDADNDGVSDAIEASVLTGVDTDNDGFIDVYFNGNIEISKWNSVGVTRDADSDKDGVSDAIEGSADTDEDGVLDFLDRDSDNDGIPDFVEARSPLADSDADGVLDMHDLDSDNDGIPDLIEAQIPRPVLAEIDTDNNGRIDITNEFRGDGIATIIESISATGIESYQPVDTDRDSVFDYLDLDSDDDGLPDLVEINGLDANGDGAIDSYTDANGDGADDAIAFSPASIVDSDGDFIPNYLDNDSDGIESPDILESLETVNNSSLENPHNSGMGCSISPRAGVGHTDATLPLLLLMGIVFSICPRARSTISARVGLP